MRGRVGSLHDGDRDISYILHETSTPRATFYLSYFF